MYKWDEGLNDPLTAFVHTLKKKKFLLISIEAHNPSEVASNALFFCLSHFFSERTKTYLKVNFYLLSKISTIRLLFLNPSTYLSLYTYVRTHTYSTYVNQKRKTHISYQPTTKNLQQLNTINTK